jgi:hypothetical protein
VRAGYETLRAQALTGIRGTGWALVVRRGVGAWLAACMAAPAPPPAAIRATPVASRLPPGLHAEVVVLLAGMVVGREARA